MEMNQRLVFINKTENDMKTFHLLVVVWQLKIYFDFFVIACKQRAGYSLEELFHLCRSTNNQQRMLALKTLANVLTKVRQFPIFNLLCEFNIPVEGMWDGIINLCCLLSDKEWWPWGSGEFGHFADSLECRDPLSGSLGNGWQCRECGLHGC